MPRGRSRDQYNPSGSRIVIQAEVSSPDVNPWDQELTADQRRQWIINHTPGITTVVFRDELREYASEQLRTMYADPSVFFADPIASYEPAHDPQTRQNRHNWRRLARQRHYQRLQMIADGMTVRRIMCICHPWIWRRHVEYLRDNNKKDDGRPTDAFRQQAERNLENEFIELAEDWADSRPRPDTMEVPPTNPSNLMYERKGMTREDFVEEAREQGVQPDEQRMKPTPRDQPPTPGSSRRVFSVPSDRDRPSRSDRAEYSRQKRHSSRSFERPAKVEKKEGSESSSQASGTRDLREQLSRPAGSASTSPGSAIPERGRAIRLINVPTRNQPPHPDLRPRAAFVRNWSTQTDPYLLLDNEEEQRHQRQVERAEDEARRLRDKLDNKSDDLWRSNCKIDSLESELRSVRQSRDDAKRDVASYRAQKVKHLQTIKELEEQIAQLESFEREREERSPPDTEQDDRAPFQPAFRPQLPATPPRPESPTPSTSSGSSGPPQRPELLRSITASPRRQEAEKARVSFGKNTITKFTVDKLNDDGRLNVVLDDEPVVTSIGEAEAVGQAMEQDIVHAQEEEDELLAFMDTDENRISEADQCNCPDAIDGLVMKPHKYKRKKEASHCNYPACLMKQTPYYSYHYDEQSKGCFSERPSFIASNETDWRLDSRYDIRGSEGPLVMGNDLSEFKYPQLMPKLMSRSFPLAIDEAGFFTLELLPFSPGMIKNIDEKYKAIDQQSKKDAEAKAKAAASKVKSSKKKAEIKDVDYPRVSDNAFVGIVIGNTDGDVLLIKCLFDGKKAELIIPPEVVSWIQDKKLFKLGFNMHDSTIPKLRALGIDVNNPVCMENWTALCYPQIETKEFKPVSRNAAAKYMGMPGDMRFRGDGDEVELGKIWSDEVEMSSAKANFATIYKNWTTLMKSFVKYMAFIPLALMDKSCVRLGHLDGLGSGGDIRPIQHMIMSWLVGYNPRTIYTFQDDEEFRRYVTPFPDWMSNDVSRYKGAFAFKNAAWPLFFTEKLYATWPAVFRRISSMRRRHEVNFDYVSEEAKNLVGPHFRLTARFGGATEVLERDCANIRNRTGGMNFPHGCEKCGNFAHTTDSCQENVTCQYKLCSSEDKTSHATRLCPTLNGVCQQCLFPGHEAQHHKVASMFRLWLDYKVIRRIGFHSAKLHDINLGYEFKKTESDQIKSRIVLHPLVDVEPQ